MNLVKDDKVTHMKTLFLSCLMVMTLSLSAVESADGNSWDLWKTESIILKFPEGEEELWEKWKVCDDEENSKTCTWSSQYHIYDVIQTATFYPPDCKIKSLEHLLQSIEWKEGAEILALEENEIIYRAYDLDSAIFVRMIFTDRATHLISYHNLGIPLEEGEEVIWLNFLRDARILRCMLERE